MTAREATCLGCLGPGTDDGRGAGAAAKGDLAPSEKKGSGGAFVAGRGAAGLINPGLGGAAASLEGVVVSVPAVPVRAGAVRRLVAAGPAQSGSQKGSGAGESSDAGWGALAAAAKRLRKAWLDAPPDGSYDGSSSGRTGQGPGPLAVTGAELVKSWRNASRAARSSAAEGVGGPPSGLVTRTDAWSIGLPISAREQLHVPS